MPVGKIIEAGKIIKIYHNLAYGMNEINVTLFHTGYVVPKISGESY